MWSTYRTLSNLLCHARIGFIIDAYVHTSSARKFQHVQIDAHLGLNDRTESQGCESCGQSSQDGVVTHVDVLL